MKKVYLIAVIFALLAGFATYMFAKQLDEKTTIKDADTVTVIVAAQDIPKNTKITQEMLNNQENPYFAAKTIVSDYTAPNYITDASELLDCVTVDAIYANEQINKNRFQEEDGKDVALSFKLEDGMVAYSFKAKEVKGVDGYISEGDTVDIVVYEVDENDKEKNKAKVAYEDLKVIKVSTNTDNASSSASGSKITEYSTLTVEVSEDDALKLYEIENEYEYKLILNPRS